jgi:hypothetical protein
VEPIVLLVAGLRGYERETRITSLQTEMKTLRTARLIGRRSYCSVRVPPAPTKPETAIQSDPQSP